jgi:hypothetical protein
MWWSSKCEKCSSSAGDSTGRTVESGSHGMNAAEPEPVRVQRMPPNTLARRAGRSAVPVNVQEMPRNDVTARAEEGCS